MLQIIGIASSIDREEVTNVAEPFTSVTVVLMSGDGRKDFVRLGRDFPVADIPAVGEDVTLAVWPRPYVSKKNDTLGCGFTAYRRVKAPSLV